MASLTNYLPYITLNIENLKDYDKKYYVEKNKPVFLFDIDDTLYKMSKEMQKVELESWNKVFETLKKKTPTDKSFREILTSSKMFGGGFYSFFNISASEAEKLRGTFDFKNYIQKDEKLINELKNLTYSKWCFTNGPKGRAEAILKCMEIEDYFDGVVCVDDTEMGTRGKPFDFAYEFVNELLGLENNENVYFFDDNNNNIKSAEKFGWNSYLIDPETDLVETLKKINEELRNKEDR